MDFWLFLLSYGGIGAVVGAVHARYNFKVSIADPNRNAVDEEFTGRYDTYERPITKKRQRTELERTEACAASAARWGWVSAIFWPIIVVSLFFMGLTAFVKNLAGGKELREVRAAKAKAEIEARAAKYAAEARESWKQQYGPDAPEDVK